MWTEQFGTGQDFGEQNMPSFTGDPVQPMYIAALDKPQFNQDETGIYHPNNHQTLKMRSNGMADLFVDNDTGVRFDPYTQSINFFGNAVKNHIHEFDVWASGDMNQYIQGDWLLQSKGTVTLEGDQKIVVKTGLTTITIQSGQAEIDGNIVVNVNGNLDANVGGHAKINAEQVQVSASTVDIEGVVTLEGERVLHRWEVDNKIATAINGLRQEVSVWLSGIKQT